MKASTKKQNRSYKEGGEELHTPQSIDEGKGAEKLDPSPSHRVYHVPLDLIDRPDNPSRVGFDDAKQRDLEVSMRRDGLIQAVCLRHVGKRYEIIAGDRRCSAARTIGWSGIPATVVKADDTYTNRIRIQENFIRDDVNRVDLSLAIARYKQDTKVSNKQIAKDLGMSEAFISETLTMHEWPVELVAAVGEGSISFSAARELSHVTVVQDLLYYLRSAVQSGCTQRLAKQWRFEWEAAQKYKQIRPAVEDMNEPTLVVEPAMTKCFLCSELGVYTEMACAWIHHPCVTKFLEEMKKIQSGE